MWCEIIVVRPVTLKNCGIEYLTGCSKNAFFYFFLEFVIPGLHIDLFGL
jgi:hypothetical protein